MRKTLPEYRMEPISVALASYIHVGGILYLPPETAKRGIIFAHGTGKIHEEQIVLAEHFYKHGFGTLLFNLLTEQEAAIDERTPLLRHDHAMLGERLVEAIIFAAEKLYGYKLGILGDDVGAAAAVTAAARLPHLVNALVSRSGRLEEAKASWPFLSVPTLLLVEEQDECLESNRQAFAEFPCEKDLRTIKSSECPECDENSIADLVTFAVQWFDKYL